MKKIEKPSEYADLEVSATAVLRTTVFVDRMNGQVKVGVSHGTG